MKIVFSEPSKQQLKEIWQYYRWNASLKVARTIQSKILSRIRLLKDNPKLGAVEFTLEHLKAGHRRLVVGNYKIVYRIFDEFIFIDAIFDARQAPEKLERIVR